MRLAALTDDGVTSDVSRSASHEDPIGTRHSVVWWGDCVLGDSLPGGLTTNEGCSHDGERIR